MNHAKPENGIVFALNSMHIASRSTTKYASSSVKPLPELRPTQQVPPEHIFMIRTDGKPYGSTDVAVAAMYSSPLPGIPKIPTRRSCNPETFDPCANTCEECVGGFIQPIQKRHFGILPINPELEKCYACIHNPCTVAEPLPNPIITDVARYSFGPCYHCTEFGISRINHPCRECDYAGEIPYKIPSNREEYELWEKKFEEGTIEWEICPPGTECVALQEILIKKGPAEGFSQSNFTCIPTTICTTRIDHIRVDNDYETITDIEYREGCWHWDPFEAEYVESPPCRCADSGGGLMECFGVCPPPEVTSTLTPTPTVTSTVTSTPTATTPTSTPT